MKFVSIDVGIKNLSFCLFEDDGRILKWDNINLIDEMETKCCECNKPAKFCKNGKEFCKKHTNKNEYIIPTSEFKSLSKKSKQYLIDLASKYNIVLQSLNPNKTDIIKQIESKCYETISSTNATKVDLVTIGRNIQRKFDTCLSDHLNSIEMMIIENQIGPLANKMKTIQGMISQYFIMKNNNIQIEFISASNKLKDFVSKDKTEYKQRKKLGTTICLQLINENVKFNEWVSFLNTHKKKDDLADCFLQGLWFINHKLN
jgi:hypothetical protein